MIRQAYDLTLAGALGALCGLYLYVELVRADSVWVRDALAGLAIGGSVSFFLAASGPIRDGAWFKLAREASRGVLAGSVGGALGLVAGEIVLSTIQGGLIGRSLSWAILGLGIGAGQGLAGGSRQRLAFGIMGGSIGGAVGGLLFESLRLAMQDRYDLGQGIGIVMLGAGLGLAPALVEQTLRRTWVQVIQGRQEGRSYLLTGPRSTLGLDERADVGLFGDPTVSRRHAEIARDGRDYLLINHAPIGRSKVNGEVVESSRPLRDGDRIELGQTSLTFRRR